jgi:hypothetical protein
VISIGEGLFGFVRVEREDVPQEYAFLDPIQDLPDHSRSSLCDSGALCRPLQGDTPAAHVMVDVNVVRKRQACASASAIPEVAPNPDRVDRRLQRTLEHRRERYGTPTRRVGAVMHHAAIGIGVEAVIEPKRTQRLDERVQTHGCQPGCR